MGTDELHYRYESRVRFLATVADTTISLGDGGQVVGAATRSSGLGSIDIALTLDHEGHVATLHKGFATTGSWDVTDAADVHVATIQHRLFSHRWTFTAPDGRDLGDATAGGMRPRGELRWAGQPYAWVERASLWSSGGIFSTRRVWDLRLRLLDDPVARLVALTLPLAFDHRERASESD